MVATRICASCGDALPREAFSKNQWSKKKDGRFVSRCMECVEEATNAPGACTASGARGREGDSSYASDGGDRGSSWEDVDSLDLDNMRIERRLDNPSAPPHPDLGKQWTPAKTMEVASGSVCFGLAHEVQSGAKDEAMTLEDAGFYYGDFYYSPAPHNAVAKNGTWHAYKLIDRDTRYDEHYKKYQPERLNEERIAGWFLCHEDLEDPVAEVYDMVYNTFGEDNGGNYKHWRHVMRGQTLGGSNQTHPFHVCLGYVVIARCGMGYNMPPNVTEEEESAIREEGLFVVDSSDAGKEKELWTNAIGNMHTGGDYDVGRLKYDDDGLCEAFLLAGTATEFQWTHFTSEGTAPLGREYEDWDDSSLESEGSEHIDEVAMRCCSICEVDLPKAEYSKNQWSKKKDGVFNSKCKLCVGSNEVRSSGESRHNGEWRDDEISESDIPFSLLTFEEKRARVQEKMASSLGDGYDDQTLQMLDRKMCDYFLPDYSLCYDHGRNKRSANPEEPTNEEVERYKKSALIRKGCLRKTHGIQAMSYWLGGQGCKNLQLYLAFYNDLRTYHYAWFEIIFKDSTSDLHMASKALVKLATVSLELGADLDELLEIMETLSEVKDMFQSTAQDLDVEGGMLEYDCYLLKYQASIELAKEGKEDDADQYFEEALTMETTWGYHDEENRHCRKLLGYAIGKEVSLQDLDAIDEENVGSAERFYYQCVQAYLQRQSGSVQWGPSGGSDSNCGEKTEAAANQKDNCPLCLESLPPFWDVERRLVSTCCGSPVCVDCMDKKHEYLQNADDRGTWGREEEQLHSCCPLCRAQMPEEGEIRNMLLEKFERGQLPLRLYCNLGHHFDSLAGAGVERNVERACEIWRLGAERGDPNCQYVLGDQYYRGNGVPKSVDNAKRWYLAATEQGHAVAEYNLAVLMDKEGNDAEYLRYMRGSAAKGYDEARYSLGLAHYNGEHGLGGSLAGAICVSKPAAERGHARSMFVLGSALCCREPDVASPGGADFTKGVHWLRRAAEKGDEDAISHLKRIDEEIGSVCFMCYQKQLPTEKAFLRCSRCRAAWYCRKDCQRQHWKTEDGGHKLCCIKWDS